MTTTSKLKKRILVSGSKKPRGIAGADLRYLRPHELQMFDNLLFAARHIVEGLYSGRHKSPFRGSAPEFIEYKHYTSGDPLYAVDWKAFGRTDRYYIRIREKETDMNCYVLLDSSASMGFYGVERKLDWENKYDYASLLTAALGYLMIKQGDKVSLTMFDTRLRKHIPCGGTFPHLYNMLHHLEKNRPGKQTGISRILREVCALFPRKGLLIVISDFYDDVNEIFNAFNLYTHRGFEVLLFHLLHHDELELPPIPQVLFQDIESGESLSCNTLDIREKYLRLLQEHIADIRRRAHARNMTYHLIDTDDPYDQALRRYMLKRSAVRL